MGRFLKMKSLVIAAICTSRCAFGLDLNSAKSFNNNNKKISIESSESKKTAGKFAKILGISSLAVGIPIGIYSVNNILSSKIFNNEENYTPEEKQKDKQDSSYQENKGTPTSDPGVTQSQSKNDDNKDSKKMLIHVFEIIFGVMLIAYLLTITFKISIGPCLLKKELKECNPGKGYYVEYESYFNPFDYSWWCDYEEENIKENLLREGDIDINKIKNSDEKNIEEKYVEFD